MRIKGLGKMRWPWHAVVVTPAERAPLVMLNRYPGQVIGVAFRLPDEPYFDRRIHKQLSITWSRPDVKQYPRDWERARRRDVLGRTADPVEAATGPRSSGPCPERYPDPEDDVQCWLIAGHEGPHMVDGGTYRWSTPGSSEP